MRFVVGQIFEGTTDTTMRAEVLEVWNDGRDAKLNLLTHDHSTFELNAGAVMAGHQHWRLVP
ncbi:hypothetical protein [Bradyrhizobium sp. HKCCYLRH1062]|uniref:hypothetical protein n=1 Tax=unclassified Bradyrhizobium TaxID=2631580 RepID=UPI003EB9CA88